MLDYLKEKTKNKQNLLSFIIVFAILAFLILNANLEELISHIKRIKLTYFMIGILVFYLSFLPRFVRYKLLLKNIEINQKLKNISEIYFLSWFANLITPAKLGDLYRSYLIKKNYGNKKSETLGATFVERLIDLTLLIILISIAGFLIIEESTSKNIKNTLLIAYLLIILLFASIIFLKRFREKINKLVPEKFKHIIPNFEKSVSTSVKKKNIIGILILTLIYWTLEISTLYFVALSLNVSLSPMLIVFVTLVSALTSIIPVTPSGAGAAEAGVTAALVFSGISYNLAFAIAIVHRSIDYWSGLITGSIVYIKSKVK